MMDLYSKWKIQASQMRQLATLMDDRALMERAEMLDECANELIKAYLQCLD